LSLICLVLVIANGQFLRALIRSPGSWLIAYSTWLVFSAAFSVWPGGSVALLRDQWIKSVLVFFIVKGLISTVPDLRRTCRTLAMASAVAAIMVLALGIAGGEGRVALAAGTLSNPNDVAVHLLLFAPFVWWWSQRSTGLPKLVPWTFLFLILLACAKTGSRSGALALLGMTIYAFVRSGMRQKLRIAALAGVAVLLVGLTVPSVVVKRYLTAFWDADELSGVEEGSLDAAQGSKESRIQALKISLQVTRENPLLGVGPGMYMVAEDEKATSEDRRSSWHDTHNTFTQVSSESGLPALWFYGAVLVYCFRAARRVVASPTELHGLGSALTLALVSYAIGSAFGNFAYSTYLPALAGLSAAMDDLAARLPVQARSRDVDS
jgi:hypothetical protein